MSECLAEFNKHLSSNIKHAVKERNIEDVEGSCYQIIRFIYHFTAHKNVRSWNFISFLHHRPNNIFWQIEDARERRNLCKCSLKLPFLIDYLISSLEWELGNLCHTLTSNDPCSLPIRLEFFLFILIFFLRSNSARYLGNLARQAIRDWGSNFTLQTCALFSCHRWANFAKSLCFFIFIPDHKKKYLHFASPLSAFPL